MGSLELDDVTKYREIIAVKDFGSLYQETQSYIQKL